MCRALTIAISLIAVVFIGVGARAGAEDCHLVRYVALPITIDQAGGVTVPIPVNDSVETLLVDTGGVYSMLTQSTVNKLKLRPMMMQLQWLTMFGGRQLDHYVSGVTIQIGPAKVRDRSFVVMPDDGLPAGDEGILGPDILAAFDADFDFAAGKLNLFLPKGECDAVVVYWTHDVFAAIPFKLDDGRHINVNLMLDGKEVPAILDTGSSRSVMSLEAAEDLFGHDKAQPKDNDKQQPFKQLTLQGVVVNNPAIVLVPDDHSKVMNGYRQPKLILGMGVLRQLHMYIAYKQHVVYFTSAEAH